MNIYISRSGQSFGPYPLESLADMIQAGNVLSTDLLCPEGGTDWVPVAEFQAAHPPKPKLSVAKPPAMASGDEGPPVIAEGAVGHAGEYSDVEQAILHGGRFVLYQYCVSVLVMTFKRASSPVFLRGDQDGLGPALQYSLISLVAGWWGIPWGPIWTIASLVNNTRGGTDVTQAVLTDRFGPARAAQLMARRQAPVPRGMGLKMFRWALVGCVLLLVGGIGIFGYGVYRAGERERNRPRMAGETEFEVANDRINLPHGTVAFGNSAQAIAVATHFSRTMKSLREQFFEAGQKSGRSLRDNQFLTYCELRPQHCVILVHVSELRRFTREAQKSLGEMAWFAAQSALKKNAVGRSGMPVAVGVRGEILYDRVLLGQYQPAASEDETGLAATHEGNRSREKLFEFFQPPARTLSAPDSHALTNR